MSLQSVPGPGEIWAARRRLRPLLQPTPLLRSTWIGETAGDECHFKLESLQPTGSFKIRGAYNKLSAAADSLGPEILTASSGNHGAAVAMAASELGLKAHVVVPLGAPAAKISNIRGFGAEVIEEGASYDEAEAFALRTAEKSQLPLIHPFSDRDVIAGQGTAALEVFDVLDPPLTFVVPVGGGGLISGVALAAASVSPANAVVGVQPEASQPMVQSYRSGRLVEVSHRPTLSEATSGGISPGTFRVVMDHVDAMIAVSEDEIAEAIRQLVSRERLIVEGAGALAVAAVLGGRVPAEMPRPLVLILSGRNIDAEVLISLLNGGDRKR